MPGNPAAFVSQERNGDSVPEKALKTFSVNLIDSAWHNEKNKGDDAVKLLLILAMPCPRE